MKKILLAIIFILILTIASFGQTVMDFNGNDWATFTESEKTMTVVGAMMGSAMNRNFVYELDRMNMISKETRNILYNLNDMSIQIGYVMDEVDKWYNETRQWDAPVYVIIYTCIGNLDEMYSLMQNYERMNNEKM